MSYASLCAVVFALLDAQSQWGAPPIIHPSKEASTTQELVIAKVTFYLEGPYTPFCRRFGSGVSRCLYRDWAMPHLFVVYPPFRPILYPIQSAGHPYLSRDDWLSSHSKEWLVPSFERLNAAKNRTAEPTNNRGDLPWVRIRSCLTRHYPQ